MKNKISFFLVLFVLMLLPISCINNIENPVGSLNTKINISMKQNLSKNGTSLILSSKTDSLYDCINYLINYSILNQSNNIEIKFINIITPAACIGGAAPAQASIIIKGLSTGKYNLQFLANGRVSNTTLTVDPNFYQLDSLNSEWVKVSASKILRIPPNTIWGYVGYFTDSLDTKANSFIDSLKSLSVKNNNFLPGDYGNFTIDSTGYLLPPKDNTYKDIKSFIFVYTNNITTVINLMRYYGKNNLINISLFTSIGDVYYSWNLPVKKE